MPLAAGERRTGHERLSGLRKAAHFLPEGRPGASSTGTSRARSPKRAFPIATTRKKRSTRPGGLRRHCAPQPGSRLQRPGSGLPVPLGAPSLNCVEPWRGRKKGRRSPKRRPGEIRQLTTHRANFDTPKKSEARGNCGPFRDPAGAGRASTRTRPAGGHNGLRKAPHFLPECRAGATISTARRRCPPAAFPLYLYSRQRPPNLLGAETGVLPGG